MFGPNGKLLKCAIGIGFAACIYVLAPESVPEAARRVMAIFALAAFFWAFEAIPLFATSILVVVLESLLIGRPGGVLDMPRGGYKVFLQPFGSPVIILFFGGFVLAAALHKYRIDRAIAIRLLGIFGRRPFAILAGFMVATALLSMWMSDTATTAMMIPMLMPLLDQFKKEDPFTTALILAVPFSALIGGMGTPVGTPPNAIAIGLLAEQGVTITFLDWMKMAVPLGCVLLIMTAAILYLLFPPLEKNIDLTISDEGQYRPGTKPVIAIAVGTIGLWLTSGLHGIPSDLVALLSACMFAVTGLLDRHDFRGINWDILILMWGGLALGEGMAVSGLTDWVIAQPIFEQQGFRLVAAFCGMAVLLSTFMSNTATANLLIPFVVAIPERNPVVVTAVIALSCSLAMALPVSTPPNAIAFSTNRLKSIDMLRAGVLISILSAVLILIGYQFLIPAAFGLK